MKTKRLKAIMLLILTIGMLVSMCGCGDKSKDYLGTYIGQQGSVLILKEDGICKYKDAGDDDTETGTWSIEDNKIIVRECLDYDIYADIENSSEALLFQADKSRWNDELFVKSN